METKTENKKLTIQEKRAKLKELSEQAREFRELEGDESLKINDIIIEQFYTNETHTEFSTFKGWIKKGYAVKKGETAFSIWGKPKQENEKGEVEPIADEDDEKGTFYPIAYIFSNAQVQPLKKKESA